MIFPALLRRTLAFVAFLLLAAFSLLLIHQLMRGSLPSPIAGIGAAAAAAVLGICVMAMTKTDDYLTPRHTRYFFITTTFIAFLLAIGINSLIFLNDDLPGSFQRSFGVGSLGTAFAYSCIAWMRIREASLLPDKYRPEKNHLQHIVLPAIVSIPALLAAAGILAWNIQPLLVRTEPEIVLPEPKPEPVIPAKPDNLSERAEEVFEIGKRALEEGRYRAAHGSFRRAADLRHPGATYELARLYHEAGFLHDPDQALEYLTTAAELDHLEAIFLLGKSYRHGEFGLEKNPEEALRLLQIAAERGHLQAQSQLAHLFNTGETGEPDLEAAFHWFLKAAEQGDPVAQNDVGICYIQGKGVETNVEKGIEWLIQAAEQGVAVAEYNLGRAFYSGELVEQDHGRAHMYFQRLAEKQIPFGFQMIGLQYLHGEGSEKNEQAAFEAFAEGAARGDTISRYYLGYCFLEGLGTQKNSSAAIEHLNVAATENHAGAQLLLGNIYRDGRIILADEIEAAKWYHLSAQNGSEEASENLKKLTADFSASQIRQLEERLDLFARQTAK